MGKSWQRNGNVEIWIKNDNFGFEVLYVYWGVVRKYRTDFIIHLKNGGLLGKWSWDVSFDPGNIQDIAGEALLSKTT